MLFVPRSEDSQGQYSQGFHYNITFCISENKPFCISRFVLLLSAHEAFIRRSLELNNSFSLLFLTVMVFNSCMFTTSFAVLYFLP
jgi:hypothetical protein